MADKKGKPGPLNDGFVPPKPPIRSNEERGYVPPKPPKQKPIEKK